MPVELDRKNDVIEVQWFPHYKSINSSDFVSCVNHAGPRFLKMSNGVMIPFVGFGLGGEECTAETFENALKRALEVKYLHIDLTQIGCHEKLAGQIFKEYFTSGKLVRQDIFITAKLPLNSIHDKSVKDQILSQIQNLNLMYIDLYLVSSPSLSPDISPRVKNSPRARELDWLLQVWNGMEEIYNLRLARSIGLRGFNIEQFQKIMADGTIRPHNVQVELQNKILSKELVCVCRSTNVSLTAYAPFGDPEGEEESFLSNASTPHLVQFMISKYAKTVAQLLIRHFTQKNIVVVLKNKKEDKMKEAVSSLNFSFVSNDIKELDSLEPFYRQNTDGTDVSNQESDLTLELSRIKLL